MKDRLCSSLWRIKVSVEQSAMMARPVSGRFVRGALVRIASCAGGTMIRIFSHYVSKTAVILLLLEILILLLAATLTSLLWLADGSRLVHYSEVYLSSTIFALVIVFSMSALGMYQHRSREDIRNTLLRILPSFALGFAVLSVMIRFIPSLQFGRGSVLIFGLGAIGVLLARLVVFKSAQSALMEGRLILVGGGALARECM